MNARLLDNACPQKLGVTNPFLETDANSLSTGPSVSFVESVEDMV